MNTKSSAKRVYITRQIPELGISMLKEKGYDVVMGKDKRPVSTKKIVGMLKTEEKKGKGFDAIISLLTEKITTEIIDAAPNVKIVSNYAMGYDNIDVPGLKARNVIVTNAPGAYTDTIAEHTVAMILAATTHMAAADRFVRAGKYKGWDPMIFIGTDISGKTVGLIGAGRIGERTAYHLAKGFGCKIVYFDMRPCEAIEKDCGARRMETVDALLAEADIVSLHVPLLPSTHHMVDAGFLGKMKQTAFLINTSRGPVVDEVALVAALKAKHIAGAAIDVYEFEPKLAKGLSKLENVVLTPHIASASEFARNEMSRVAAQNVIDALEGRTPKGIVLE